MTPGPIYMICTAFDCSRDYQGNALVDMAIWLSVLAIAFLVVKRLTRPRRWGRRRWWWG